jgi:hypothetical protein
MHEPSASYVTKGEFRMVGFGLAALLLAVFVLLCSLRKPCTERSPGGEIGGTGGGGGKNSPILVRGGSMTAFTVYPTASDGWAQGKSGLQCVDIATRKGDTFSVTLYDSAESNKGGTYPLPVGGIIDFRGQGRAGFKLTLYQRNCQQTNSSHFSIEADTIDGGQFYKTSLPSIGTHTGNLRFLSTVATCGAGIDEDMCERMAEVDVSGIPSPTLSCGDGDCSAAIEINHP